MATIEEIEAALAQTEERIVRRFDSALRDLEDHMHHRFDALEAYFDRMEKGYSRHPDQRTRE